MLFGVPVVVAVVVLLSPLLFLRIWAPLSKTCMLNVYILLGESFFYAIYSI